MEEQNLSTSKQAILDAAQELLGQYGYAGLSMRELAQASGLAKATIYHYFHDKEEIFRQVMERDMRLVHEHIVAAIENETSACGKLQAFIATYFALVHERRTSIMSVMREISKHKELFREVICAHRHTHLSPLMNLIQQGIDEGVFRPTNVEYTTYSLLGMLNSLAVFPLFNEEGLDAHLGEAESQQAATEHILQLILSGIQAPAQPAPELSTELPSGSSR